MIRLIIGASVGSGKSVTATREISMRKNPVFTNFDLSLPNVTRLKTDMIITKEIKSTKRNGDNVYELKVNWEFWNTIKDDGFDIVIDELHNVADSRMSMSKWNVLFTQWISQIRKILSSNEKYDLILISQKLENIDIRIRRLAHEIIYCTKITANGTTPTRLHTGKIKPIQKTYIKLRYFRGAYCIEKFQCFMAGEKTFDRQMIFLANPYFQYYDSYEILDFGDDTYV